MRMTEKSCEYFVDVLASKEPVPGGGGAAALIGAVGTALSDMVGSLTVGKKKYADVQNEIAKLKTEAAKLEKEFINLVTRDAEVFEPLSKAYGLPKETEEEQKFKAEVMEKALDEACSVPLQIMECACKAVELTDAMSKIGTAIAISDAGCGAASLRAALSAASLNVFINTKSMADREKAEKLESHAQGMLDKYIPICDEIFARVLDRIK
ncbi:MAG: cyclodeaminase/cyclohydrolase family protein [Firmicutes bacterium]|jgi:formiminotetrahydrofolate cyclodeaminase|nr:cyclodeaminase/cyclohydrolase family protein [Bacillota bacterium]